MGALLHRQGHPREGVIVAEGEIPALAPWQSYIIRAEVTQSGRYAFLVHQRPGYRGQENAWSPPATLDLRKCKR